MKRLILFILFIPMFALAQVSVNVEGDTSKFNTLDITGNASIGGDLVYEVTHGIASTDSIEFTTSGAAQYIYYKVDPTGDDTLHHQEMDGMLFLGDSLITLATGHYQIFCYLNITTANANDKIRVKIFENDVVMADIVTGRWIINSDGSGGDSHTSTFQWYVEAEADDVYSVRAANLTGARATLTSDLKLVVFKVPEH